MFALTHFPMRTSTCSLQYIEHYLHSQYYSRSTSYSHITQLLPWLTVNSSERKQKVVVLREQERATIYTTKMSKQVTKGHVRDAVHMYLVN
jgi:hypothetical protein